MLKIGRTGHDFSGIVPIIHTIVGDLFVGKIYLYML